MNFLCDLFKTVPFHRTSTPSTDFSIIILSNKSSLPVKSIVFSNTLVICFLLMLILSFGGLARSFFMLYSHLHQKASINIEKARKIKLTAGVDLLDSYLTEVLRTTPEQATFSKIEVSPCQEISTASIFPFDQSASVDFKILIKQFSNFSNSANLLEKQGTFSQNSDLLFRCPVNGVISSYFGMRTDPVFEGSERHNGIDIANNLWTAVRGTANGKVTFAGWNQWFGNEVIISHGNTGYQTIYAHLQKIKITTGDSVASGQVIGFLGSTGKSTGPHLHYEIHFKGKPVNPIPFLHPSDMDID